MNIARAPWAAMVGVALTWFVGGATASGAILSITNANVQNYFGAMSDTIQLGDPAVLAPWTAGANGPYPITGAASVPAPPSSPLWPGTLPSSTSFTGGPYSSVLNDLPSSTLSQGTITANAPGGSNVVDGNVIVNMDLFNPNPSPNFAYHQMNFEVDYLANTTLNGGIGGAPTFFLTGSTGGGASYAQFAAHILYFWQDINAAGVASGFWTPLGNLDYTMSFAPNTTFLNVPVTPNTGSSLITTPTGGGELAIVGEVFVAGDPAEIHVRPTPEPSSAILLSLGAAGAGIWKWRRRTKVVKGSTILA